MPSRRARYPASDTRTSYQVGRPWMLEGKMFFGLTGMPMRNSVLAKMPLADAEPEPLTVANFTTKSLIPLIWAVYLARTAQLGSSKAQTQRRCWILSRRVIAGARPNL